MVSLPVSVMTRAGKLVAGLEKENFQVFEDKVQQKIEAFTAAEEPFSVALLLDTSGSTQSQLDRIQREAIRFIDLLKPEDSVAIVSMEDLPPAYEAIARELSSQCSIGCYPTNPRHEGKYRRVEVKVTKPGLYVQTRKGYHEPDSSRKKR